MKKNISINISGIIFHIEEDGYTELKSYLEAITKYFSNFEDSVEIIADIESRIAEIFLAKLDDHKQVILKDDVDALINTMGTVADFEAVESEVGDGVAKEQVEDSEDPPVEESEKSNKQTEATDESRKRLYRDDSRKLIGGVAAGIGYYLGLDAIWVRLVFALLLINFLDGIFSVFVFTAYVILWIVVPGSKALGDDAQIRKMFRDAESRVLGGVASGIAAYFGIDVTVIRLLFIVSVFFSLGTSVLIYIILWIITPEAKSITEKMQMQGEPVTLQNIQQTLRRSLTNEKGEESAFAKILLFPFRVLAAVFEAIGKVLGPFSKVLIEGLRIFAGLIIGFVGFVTMMALLLVLLFALRILPHMAEYHMLADIPTHVISASFSPWAYLSTFIVAFIPFFFITLLGISIVAKRMVIRSTLGWSAFGLWVVGFIAMAIFVPSAVASFSEEGQYIETEQFDLNTEKVTLKLNPVDGPDYDDILRIRPHNDSTFKLETKYLASGPSRSQAKENAQMVDYQVAVTDSSVVFDSNITFKDKAKFRAQRVLCTLYVPYGQIFAVEDPLFDILDNTFSRAGYWPEEIDESQEWVFTADELVCASCPEKPEEEEDSEELKYYSTEEEDSKGSIKGDIMTFELAGFDEVEVHGKYQVYIEEGDEFDVKVVANKKYQEHLMVRKHDDILEVKMSEKHWDIFDDWPDEDRVKVFIQMPKVERVKSSGFCHIVIDKFVEEELKLVLSGASTANLDVEVDDLYLYLEGATWAEISGKANYAKAKISGASSLRAPEFKVNTFDVTAKGVSNARIRVSDKLKASVYGISHIKYYGDPEIQVNSHSGLSSIDRID